MLACSFDDVAKMPADASDSWSFPILSALPNLSSTCVLQIWWLSHFLHPPVLAKPLAWPEELAEPLPTSQDPKEPSLAGSAGPAFVGQLVLGHPVEQPAALAGFRPQSLVRDLPAHIEVFPDPALLGGRGVGLVTKQVGLVPVDLAGGDTMKKQPDGGRACRSYRRFRAAERPDMMIWPCSFQRGRDPTSAERFRQETDPRPLQGGLG